MHPGFIPPQPVFQCNATDSDGPDRCAPRVCPPAGKGNDEINMQVANLDRATVLGFLRGSTNCHVLIRRNFQIDPCSPCGDHAGRESVRGHGQSLQRDAAVCTGRCLIAGQSGGHRAGRNGKLRLPGGRPRQRRRTRPANHVTFPITAPAAGTYTMQWQMMQRYVQWFGDVASAPVTVAPPAPAPDGAITYLHTDALGSPVARSDSAGNVIARTAYEPYGRTASGNTPTIGFTGHVNDGDTGLVYMQQRYYDPVAGRFLSVDPVITDVNTGARFNRFAYANNNPFKYLDPDGREARGIAINCMLGNCETVGS